MSFRKLLPLFAVVCLAPGLSAKAQFGIYGMVTGQRFGGINCPTFAQPCASGGGRAQDYGGTFGAMYDIHTIGPVRLGADLRADVLTSNKRADSSAGGVGIFRQYDVMGGVRASVGTPINWLRPYGEVLVGYTHNNANGVYTETVNALNNTTSIAFNPQVYANQPLFKAVVGADVRLAPHFDLRAIELGLGDAFGSTNTVVVTTNTATSSTTAVAATSPSSHSIASISAGLVLHF